MENNTANPNQEISTMETEDVTADIEKYDAVYVDSIMGDDSGTGTSDKPLKTISEGLNHVNDGGTIYLNGSFSGQGNCNITLDAAPDSITFTGVENAAIDGEFSNSFATVNRGSYFFNNISFINHYKSGNEEDGGAISNLEGTLTFENCLFENNTVLGVNKGHGGAIANSGKVTIIHSTFKNNVANVTNSSGFRKNSADGGAISNLGNLWVYNSTFAQNKALRNGGAIRTQDHSTTYIDGCNFTANIAAYHLSGGSYGGAIYTWDCGLELYNSVFKNNKIYDASGYGARGGALSLNRGVGKILIYSCEFINNTADGIATVDGQSLYFDSVEAVVNYCTIDTSVYSISQSTDLNRNWWAVNDTNINALIENIPSSAAVKSFAELKISSDAKQIEVGKEINIFIDLCWNGTENQNNIDLIPVKTVKLNSTGGVLGDAYGNLINGSFKTTFTPTGKDILLSVEFGNVIFKSSLNETNEKIKIDDNFEGGNGIISIESNNEKFDFCLIEIDNVTYYVKLKNGNGNAKILGLANGKHIADFKFCNNAFDIINETKITITVNDNPDSSITSKKDTTLEAAKSVTIAAVDTNAGEKGEFIYATLKDSNGNALASKTIQIALDGKIYNVTTNDNGNARLQVNISSANTYTCAVSFKGDDGYNGASLVCTQLTVSKKSTSITASAKTFKAKAKTKSVSVTLKTSKNKLDGKTYLSKGKKLTLTVNKKTYTAKTNSKGVAKFSIKLTKKGKYNATIKFAGDKTYKAASKKIKITIK